MIPFLILLSLFFWSVTFPLVALDKIGVSTSWLFFIPPVLSFLPNKLPSQCESHRWRARGVAGVTGREHTVRLSSSPYYQRLSNRSQNGVLSYLVCPPQTTSGPLTATGMDTASFCLAAQTILWNPCGRNAFAKAWMEKLQDLGTVKLYPRI